METIRGTSVSMTTTLMANFDSLDKEFDIAPADLPKPIKKPKPIIVSNKEEDREKDYNYARSQLYNIVEKMQESIDGAMEVAANSEHPRAFEVVMNGAKNAAEVVEKLTDLHSKMEAMEKEKPQKQVSQVQNNMFVGSTAELMKMLKENQ